MSNDSLYRKMASVYLYIVSQCLDWCFVDIKVMFQSFGEEESLED